MTGKNRTTRRKTPLWNGLVISVSLHLFAVISWWTMPHPPALQEADRHPLIVQLMPVAPPRQAGPTDQIPDVPVVPEATSTPKQIAPSRIAPPLPANETPPPAVAPVEGNKPIEAVPAPAMPSAADMLQNAKRDIGKIDRELRKAYPRLPEAVPDSVQSKLEKGIAAAAKSQTTTIEELVLGDGRRMTKVTGPAGSYCAYKEHNGLTGGRDVIQQGVRTMVTTCP